MKVGFDVSASIYGTGVSQYLVNLVASLPVEQLRLFGYSLRRQSDIKRLFPQAKTYPIPPTLADFIWNRLHIYNIENLIGGIDVLHSSDWVQPPTKAKKVTTVHDLSAFLYPAEMDPLIVSVQTRRMKWVAAECDKIICVSQNTAEDLKRLFAVADSRISVIPEALPSKYLSLHPQISKNTNYVLAIGARQPRKNIRRLKKACEILRQKLIIVGEGSEMGYVSDQDMVNYLAGAQAFVYPSLYEGFGLPILEAFHYGVPVAASNTSSIPEVAGDAAVYFDPLDEEQMAKGIVEAISNREKLIAEGKKQLAKFSWATTATQTMEVYKSVC